MQEDKGPSIGFNIKTIELLDFSLALPEEALEPISSFHYDINLEQRLDVAHNYVVIICTVLIFNKEKNHLLGKLKTACVYAVENLSTLIDISTKDSQLPEALSLSLNSISISTTRGMIVSQFRGTFLHHAILPVVDPRAFQLDRN